MTKKSLRRLVAWSGILFIAFAQFVATAHACSAAWQSAASHATVAARVHAAGADASHCGHHAKAAVSPMANLCEVHCTDGTRPAAIFDLPPVALAPLPLSTLPLRTLDHTALCFAGSGTPVAASPPLILQFCRILV